MLPCFVSAEQEIRRERNSGKELILQKGFKLHGNSTPECLCNTCFVVETWIPWWTRNQRGGCTSRSQYHQDWKEKIIKSDDYLQQKKIKIITYKAHSIHVTRTILKNNDMLQNTHLKYHSSTTGIKHYFSHLNKLKIFISKLKCFKRSLDLQHLPFQVLGFSFIFLSWKYFPLLHKTKIQWGKQRTWAFPPFPPSPKPLHFSTTLAGIFQNFLMHTQGWTYILTPPPSPFYREDGTHYRALPSVLTQRSFQQETAVLLDVPYLT